jgi:preprotein translocase subunit SecB
MNEQQPQGISLRGQYIKDISFENPRAPQSLLNLTEPPAIEINVDLSAQRLQDNLFELTMHIGARANQEKQTIFLTDLAYGGIFDVPGDESTDFERLVLVDCAYLLFPFARRIIADVTRDGGFPPLQIEPVNFAGLYEQNKGNIQRAAAPGAEQPAAE